jgi:hypothetical protein
LALQVGDSLNNYPTFFILIYEINCKINNIEIIYRAVSRVVFGGDFEAVRAPRIDLALVP